MKRHCRKSVDEVTVNLNLRAIGLCLVRKPRTNPSKVLWKSALNSEAHCRLCRPHPVLAASASKPLPMLVCVRRSRWSRKELPWGRCLQNRLVVVECTSADIRRWSLKNVSPYHTMGRGPQEWGHWALWSVLLSSCDNPLRRQAWCSDKGSRLSSKIGRGLKAAHPLLLFRKGNFCFRSRK